jgi:hypothetical protein
MNTIEGGTSSLMDSLIQRNWKLIRDMFPGVFTGVVMESNEDIANDINELNGRMHTAKRMLTEMRATILDPSTNVLEIRVSYVLRDGIISGCQALNAVHVSIQHRMRNLTPDEVILLPHFEDMFYVVNNVFIDGNEHSKIPCGTTEENLAELQRRLAVREVLRSLYVVGVSDIGDIDCNFRTMLVVKWHVNTAIFNYDSGLDEDVRVDMSKHRRLYQMVTYRNHLHDPSLGPLKGKEYFIFTETVPMYLRTEPLPNTRAFETY